jgi:hypothetical protein
VKKPHKIGSQFIARRIEMLRSPAFRVLNLTGRRILDRIEIEHASHGGKDNGRLPVTFRNLIEFGIPNRDNIARGIREIGALGFAELTRHGRAGNGEFRTPNLFRLTYLPANGKRTTDEWQQIRTIEDAKEIVRKITENVTGPVTENVTVTGHVLRTYTPGSPVTKNVPLSRKNLAIYPPREGDTRDHRHRRERHARRTRARASFVDRTNTKGGHHHGKDE